MYNVLLFPDGNWLIDQRKVTRDLGFALQNVISLLVRMEVMWLEMSVMVNSKSGVCRMVRETTSVLVSCASSDKCACHLCVS